LVATKYFCGPARIDAARESQSKLGRIRGIMRRLMVALEVLESIEKAGGLRMIRVADAKEVGVGNPAEETYRHPNQNLSAA
jgi:hypothetical protein